MHGIGKRTDHPNLRIKLLEKLLNDEIRGRMRTNRTQAKKFVEAIEANRGHVISAKIINNGACTATFPRLVEWIDTTCEVIADALWHRWEQLSQKLSLPLRDVYQSPEYA